MWIKCAGDDYINLDQVGWIEVSQPGSLWKITAQIGPGGTVVTIRDSIPSEAAALAIASKLTQAFDQATF